MPDQAKLRPLLLTTAAFLAVAQACSPADTAEPLTMIRLSPAFDEAWELDQVELLSGKHEARWPEPARRLRTSDTIPIVLSDPAASGSPMRLVAWGLREGTRLAYGEVEVKPQLHSTVRVVLPLSRLSCGDWCSPGARECVGDAVRECFVVPSSGCTAWGPPGACPKEVPFCSLGRCAADCVDECSEEASRCVGPNAVQYCGQADSDSCLDWLVAEPCGDGRECDDGRCGVSADCHDDCVLGEKRCEGNASMTCGQFDPDDCLDWGPASPCPAGQSCSEGVCTSVDQCMDECSSSACHGDEYRSCGQFDIDPCLDFAPPVHCRPEDPCLLGSCDPVHGCLATPMACSTPPDSHCLDDNTLKVYSPAGSCEAGTCSYESKTVACPHCPDCDPCTGVTCNEKRPCFSALGTCKDGYCEYPFADGEACEDGDPCTVADRCSTGTCVGTAMVCEDPPPGECVHPGLLRTYESAGTCEAGTCTYVASEIPCPNGCLSGACGCVEDAATVVANGTGMHTSVAADLAHGVYVAFIEASSNSLRVARRAFDGTWTIETVATHVEDGASLAIEPLGMVHAVYVNASKRVAHAWRDGGGWSSTVVDSNTGQTRPALAVGPSGTLHVAYANTGGWLNYASKAPNQSWEVDSYVASEGEEFSDVSLAVSAQGAVHISYVAKHEPPLGIEYDTLGHLSKMPGGTWVHRTVVQNFHAVHGQYTSIVTRPDGGAIVAYRDSAIGMRVAKVTASGEVSLVSVTSAGSSPVQGRFGRLGRTTSGNLTLVYGSGPTVWVTHSANADGTAWGPREVLAQVGEATGCSLGVDASGAIHVSFHDAGPEALHYVRLCP